VNDEDRVALKNREINFDHLVKLRMCGIDVPDSMLIEASMIEDKNGLNAKLQARRDIEIDELDFRIKNCSLRS